MLSFPRARRAAAAANDGKRWESTSCTTTEFRRSLERDRTQGKGTERERSAWVGPAQVRLGYVNGLSGPGWDTVPSLIRFPWAVRSPNRSWIRPPWRMEEQFPLIRDSRFEFRTHIKLRRLRLREHHHDRTLVMYRCTASELEYVPSSVRVRDVSTTQTTFHCHVPTTTPRPDP